MGAESKMDPVELLKKAYARVVVPEADGSYTAEILEFSGCVASGDSATEAIANVEEVAADWIAATIEQGQDIPEPLDHANYSGKLVVRMTKGLHKRAARSAEREGVSLNQFIVTCIAEQVGARARPMIVYSQPQGVASFTIQVSSVPAMPANLIATGHSIQQVDTSSGGQFLSLPMHNLREQLRA